jgi:hypothetical protein
VRLDVLDPDDAAYVLINACDARNKINGRSLAIGHLLLSTGEFCPNVVSPGGDSLLSRTILRGHMDVVDVYLDSWADQVRLMTSAGRTLNQLPFSFP